MVTIVISVIIKYRIQWKFSHLGAQDTKGFKEGNIHEAGFLRKNIKFAMKVQELAGNEKLRGHFTKMNRICI